MRRCLMGHRLSLAVGLMLAAGALANCTDNSAAPTTPSFNKEPPPCDPQTGECGADGRMTGGGSTVTVGDIKITKGFTLHCDITLSNNLEINWPDNKWHLDKPITSAKCIDDPDVNPEPPPAPFDTFIGEAIG